MLDPKLTHTLVRVGERQTVGGEGMGEIRRIEVQPETVRARPIDPALELRDRVFVASDGLAAEVGVAGMQIDAVRAGNQGKRFFQVAAQFVERARLAGVVAGDGEAAAEFGAGFLEAAHVVALPAMHRDRDARQTRERHLGVDLHGGVLLAREGIRIVEHGQGDK